MGGIEQPASLIAPFGGQTNVVMKKEEKGSCIKLLGFSPPIHFWCFKICDQICDRAVLKVIDGCLSVKFVAVTDSVSFSLLKDFSAT